MRALYVIVAAPNDIFAIFFCYWIYFPLLNWKDTYTIFKVGRGGLVVSTKASESLLSGSTPDCDGGFIPESTLSVQTAAILRTPLESSLGRDCRLGAHGDEK